MPSCFSVDQGWPHQYAGSPKEPCISKNEFKHLCEHKYEYKCWYEYEYLYCLCNLFFVKMKFRNVLILNIKWNRFNFSLQSWWNCKKWSQSRKWLLIEVMIKWFDFFRNVFLMKHIIHLHIILLIIQERVFVKLIQYHLYC